MHDVGFILNVGVALLAALIGGSLARAVKLPVLIGYLVAGFVVGPYTPGVTARPEVVHSVANLGVALLMYAVGVHFSLEQLRAVWRTCLIGGGLQIAGTVALGYLVGRALGWGAYAGVFLGCALSLSSTAVMMKILEERGEMGTNHGKVMLGILIAQDLCLVLIAPVLIAMGEASHGGGAALSTVTRALVVGGMLLALTLLLAMRGVPAIMKWVTRTRSQELFVLTAVAICIVAAMAAEKAGLGLALGAFLAGLVVSETDYAHELFSQIRPLRDVFAALFFVSVGMLLDPKFLVANWQPILAVVLAIVVGKALISALAVYAAGHHARVAVFAGLGLAQIGEFSFVLASLGSDRKLIPAEVSNVILAAALITLLLAPFVSQSARPLYAWLTRSTLASRLIDLRTAVADAGPAVSTARALVLGYGRIGRYVSNALTESHVPHVVVDYDPDVLEGLRGGLVTALFGDAGSETVLTHASSPTLETAVVALPEASTAASAIKSLRKLSPNVRIVARVHREEDIARVRDAGADIVVHSDFEVGRAMIRQTLGNLSPEQDSDDARVEKEAA